MSTMNVSKNCKWNLGPFGKPVEEIDFGALEDCFIPDGSILDDGVLLGDEWICLRPEDSEDPQKLEKLIHHVTQIHINGLSNEETSEKNLTEQSKLISTHVSHNIPEDEFQQARKLKVEEQSKPTLTKVLPNTKKIILKRKGLKISKKMNLTKQLKPVKRFLKYKIPKTCKKSSRISYKSPLKQLDYKNTLNFCSYPKSRKSVLSQTSSVGHVAKLFPSKKSMDLLAKKKSFSLHRSSDTTHIPELLNDKSLSTVPVVVNRSIDSTVMILQFMKKKSQSSKMLELSKLHKDSKTVRMESSSKMLEPSEFHKNPKTVKVDYSCKTLEPSKLHKNSKTVKVESSSNQKSLSPKTLESSKPHKISKTVGIKPILSDKTSISETVKIDPPKKIPVEIHTSAMKKFTPSVHQLPCKEYLDEGMKEFTNKISIKDVKKSESVTHSSANPIGITTPIKKYTEHNHESMNSELDNDSDEYLIIDVDESDID